MAENPTDLIVAPRRRTLTGAAGSPDPIKTLFVMGLIGATLWAGREVFVPIAIAVLLSFVLAPMVRLLRRWRIGRALSVMIVVVLAFLVILGLAAVFTRQISDLAGELPKYESTVTTKVESLRGAARNMGFMRDAEQFIQKLGSQGLPSKGAAAGPTTSGDDGAAGPAPVPVVVQQPPLAPAEILRTVAVQALSPLATMGIVLIFVIFILVQREDLRDRVIRLAGSHDLQRTTAAIDDAARRLSRYFLTQTMINALFGLLIGTGLSIIGVPSAPLWGILAMILRFVPYVGAIASAIFPILLSAAVAPGWAKTIETAALFFVIEPIIGQFVEPLLYGHSTGLSPIAVLVAATFWTWLWGPVGLILSTPLTVCLVVLGRHVDQLEFLDVLLGDAPPLTPIETFYQRALAGHPLEAADQAERFLKKGSLLDYFNDVALPALHLAQADIRRGLLDDERQRRLLETIEELADALSDHPDREPEKPDEDEPIASLGGDTPDRVKPSAPGIPQGPVAEPWRHDRAVLCVPGRSPIDSAAGVMLATVLQAHGVAAKVEEGALLAGQRISRLDLSDVQLVCLSYFDAHLNPAHARFAIRRLRRRAPHVRILGAFWTPPQDVADYKALCEEAGADDCAMDLAQAVEAVLAASREEPAGEVEVAPAVA